MFLLIDTPPVVPITENPITTATLLTLFLGSLIPFMPRVAGATVKVIEAGANTVEYSFKERKAKTDAFTQVSDELKETVKRLDEKELQITQSREQLRLANEQILKATSQTTDALKLSLDAQSLLNETQNLLKLEREKNELLENKIKILESIANAPKSPENKMPPIVTTVVVVPDGPKE